MRVPSQWTLGLGIVAVAVALDSLRVTAGVGGTAPAAPQEPVAPQEPAAGEQPALPQQPTRATLASAPSATVLRLEIPVAWQLTRAGLLGPGASTTTESFRETWLLEIRPGGVLHLRTPRASAPVYVAPPHALQAEVPKAIVLSERDLARLVGLRLGDDTPPADEAEAAVGSLDRPVTINLAKPLRGGVDVSLDWSGDEHYAVHLEIGNTPLF